MRSAVFVVCATVLPALAQTAVGGAAFIPLGYVPDHRIQSRVSALAPDGTAVAGYESGPGGNTIFTWTCWGGRTPRSDLPHGIAHAITSGASVIVGYTVPEALGGGDGFRWAADSGVQLLPGLREGDHGEVFGLSADGQVAIGLSELGENHRAVRWENGSIELLDSRAPAPFRRSIATGISADGSLIVGTLWDSSAQSMFQWTQQEGLVTINIPGVYPQYVSLSADGSTIIGQGAGFDGFAFRWTAEDGIRDLGDLPGGRMESGAYGVSADGSVIVGSSSSGFISIDPPSLFPTYEAFIWDAEHGMRSLRDVLQSDYRLDLSGWTLLDATAISADAQIICGNGVNPVGYAEPWIVHLPEPGTLLLACAALAVLRRRPTAW